MNKLLPFFVLLIHLSIYAANPLLVVVLMVKNEAHVIKQTLQPFVDGGIDSFFIFDTGSTDDTVKQAISFFHEHKQIEGYIQQESFIDFATSRNRALDLAQEQFPQADFMLMPDAEWYIKNSSDLLTFCEHELNNNKPCYLIRIMMGQIDFYTPRLIRCSGPLKPRFVGVVHEVLNYSTSEKVPAHIYFENKAGAQGIEKTKKRWERDLKLLLTEFEKNPTHSRTVFYLAQTFHCLGRLEEAYNFYVLRTQLNGWQEENFIAWYRLAQVTKELSKNNTHYSWEQALGYYLQAYNLRPSRAEPLIEIALHYWNENKIDICYLFAHHACEIPYPEKDILFVEKYFYDFLRYDILGRCAGHVGKFNLGKMAVEKALKIEPTLWHLHHNLQYYNHKVVT